MNDKAKIVLDKITGSFYGLFLLFGVRPQEKIAHDVRKLLDELEEALASHCNNLWQDLTESEHEQIRSILE